MSDQRPFKKNGPAYTGKTLARPTARAGERSPADQPRVAEPIKHRRDYDNPPPSQRGQQAGRSSSRAERHRPDSNPARRAERTSRRAAAERQRDPDAKPRRSLLSRIWLWVRLLGVVAVVVLLLLGWLLHRQASDVAAAVVVPDVRANPPLVSTLVGGVNVLLIGVDERPAHLEEGIRSDTLILVRLDGTARSISLLSIPRDTQVVLPGVGETKINVAYSQGYERAAELYGPEVSRQQGGMALAAQTVEEFLDLRSHGLRVDYTAQVNFEGFVGVIDALGGVVIDVPKHIVDTAYPTPNLGYTTVEFLPGPQRMDGARALIYARTRHADSDFDRSTRQQQVMRAIVAELQARGWAGRVAALPGLLNSIKGAEGLSGPVLTTMPFDRPDMLAGLVLLASGLHPDAIGQVQISPETVPAYFEIGSNLIWDPDGVREVVRQWRRGGE